MKLFGWIGIAALAAGTVAAESALAQDQILLDTGGVIEGELLREHDDSIEFRIKNYGVVRIKKSDILRMERGSEIGATPTPTPKPPPKRYIPPEMEGHSRLDFDYEAQRYEPVPFPDAFADLNQKADDGETTGVQGVWATEEEVAAETQTTTETQATTETETAEIAAEEPAVDFASTPADAAADDPIAVIVEQLQAGERLQEADARLMIDVMNREKTDPESLSELERRALALMRGDEPAESDAAPPATAADAAPQPEEPAENEQVDDTQPDTEVAETDVAASTDEPAPQAGPEDEAADRTAVPAHEDEETTASPAAEPASEDLETTVTEPADTASDDSGTTAAANAEAASDAETTATATDADEPEGASGGARSEVEPPTGG